MSNMIAHDQPAVRRPATAQSSVVYTPRFDICETDSAFVLIGDMPGVSADAIDIRLENRTLTITGKVAPRHEEAEYRVREYGVGDYHRTFQVGDDVDPSGMEAELKDGVLTCRLPKKAEVRPMRVVVKES